MNEKLFKKSPNLKQYAEFIAKVREFNQQYDDYSQAIREATNYCIANDILSDFLREQGGKIVSILTAEFDLDVAKKVWRDEALEDRNIELAREMLADDEPIEKIVKWTKLPVDVIKSLQ